MNKLMSVNFDACRQCICCVVQASVRTRCTACSLLADIRPPTSSCRVGLIFIVSCRTSFTVSDRHTSMTGVDSLCWWITTSCCVNAGWIHSQLPKYTMSGKDAPPPKHVQITLWIENDSHYFYLYHKNHLFAMFVWDFTTTSLSVAEILLL